MGAKTRDAATRRGASHARTAFKSLSISGAVALFACIKASSNKTSAKSFNPSAFESSPFTANKALALACAKSTVTGWAAPSALSARA